MNCFMSSSLVCVLVSDEESGFFMDDQVFEKELMMPLCEANELAQGQVLSLTLWLARVYMEEYGDDNISLLLTLGMPHL